MKNLGITTIILLTSFFVFSQKNNFNKSKSYKWMLGLYWNNVYDSGLGSKQIFDVKNSWNLPLFPSAINFDIHLKKGISVDFLASYNYYKLGKIIDNNTHVSGHFFSFDTHLKYSFSSLMKQQWFDFFIIAGIGYTGRETNASQSTVGGILGGGFNFFITKRFGIQMRGAAHFNLIQINSNYAHLHLGLVYKYSVYSQNSNSTKRLYHWSSKKAR